MPRITASWDQKPRSRSWSLEPALEVTLQLQLTSCQPLSVSSWRANNSGGPASRRLPYICELYLQEPYQALIVKIKEKSPSAGEEESNHFEIHSESYVNNGLNPKETIKYWFHQESNWFGRKKYPTPALLSLGHEEGGIPAFCHL